MPSLVDTRSESIQPPDDGRSRSPYLVTAVTLALLLVTSIAVYFGTRDNPTALPSAEVSVVTPNPTATPRVRVAGTGVATPECPQLDNAGGRMKWVPSANAGPWPTDGKVAIPSLGVDAPIVKVGVDTSAQMVVPKNARDVAWLDQGEVPRGPTQNLVLAGHINYSRRAGSFSRIQSMRAGDIVNVTLNGKNLIYRVVWTCLFDRQTTQAARIMGYTENPSVTLISCGGVFDRRARTHNKRVAVRAELISQA
jgi:LPXTG-site transpeptidase (sortase) family protein